MDFLRPASWEEALAAKAEHPTAVPHRGWHRCDGRDQLRPPAPRVPPGPEPHRGARRVGGRTGHRPSRRLRPLHPDHARICAPSCPAWPWPRTRWPRRRSATAAASAATSAPPRRPVTPTPRCSPPAAEVEVESVRGSRRDPDRRVLHRREAQRARPRRADQGRAHQEGRRPAAVLQGRHPQRDGHRGVRLRPRAAPRDPYGPHRHRLGRADPGPGQGRRGVPERGARRGRLLGQRQDHHPVGRQAVRGPLLRPPATRSTTSGAPPSYRRHAVGIMARRTLGWTWESYRGTAASTEGVA